MKSRTIGIILAVLGIAAIALSLYQAQSQGEVNIIAWYDMNNDGVINYRDFDVNGDDLVNWIDVQLVQEAANSKTYIERYDFNLDGVVDQTDVDIVAQWASMLEEEEEEEEEFIAGLYDMNGDGIVDWRDFDLNNDGAVDFLDVQLVYDYVAANEPYIECYDFNRDGAVDQTDIEIVHQWLGKGKMALYDMNGDGIVDWHDLDINEDGKVDMRDIVAVSASYGSKIGDAKYNPKCDFNMDGVIDDADINLITQYFGYPLSIYNLFNITLPIGQLFINELWRMG